MDFGKLIKILGIFLSAVILNNFLRRLVRLPPKIETKRAKTFLSLTQSLISIIIFIFGLFLILSVMEIDITPLLASAGIVGIAIGFGSQTLIKDLINGLFLLIEDSIAVGDLVEIAGSRGIVERIGIRTIILRDEDGALHIIPAGAITQLVNLSRGEARINIDLFLSTSVLIDKAYKIIREEIKLLENDKFFQKLLTKKAELKGIEEIKNNKMMLHIVFYSKNGSQWQVKREFFYRIKKRFENEGIDLA